MIIKGIHHVSAITAHAKGNYHFYTDILGLRLVKKTINQDDPSVYHLFYADEMGNPGTDLTFFELPYAGKTMHGISSISTTSLRVSEDKALNYWLDRFNQHGVSHQGISTQGKRKALYFQDPEGQRLALVSDENNDGVPGGTPWKHSPVPAQYGIRGLGPVRLTVADKQPTEHILTNILTFKLVDQYPSHIKGNEDIYVFSTGKGGTGAEVHLEVRTDLPRERLGRGGVHHVAFRVEDEAELAQWRHLLTEKRVANSGIIDRYYFKALYFREPNGILFELSTDGPGFATDEDPECLGESLALPPFFEDRRKEIEANLEPLDTTNHK
ncbi:MAG TPA: ring-cleaving dioxygenase [Cerasibacillus sp.]|uniref:ring-cleaving dioxygenase n=1 Tax=Cerasibacillus sp. TaxID=2498711 RepID=UPI002F3E271E